MSQVSEKPQIIFDARTAAVEEVMRVFGLNRREAALLQKQERGENHGDIQAVDAQGDPLPHEYVELSFTQSRPAQKD